MFVGACAGSTGGGIKVSRILIAIKGAKVEMRKMAHPHQVLSTKFEGNTVTASLMNNVSSYLAVLFDLWHFLSACQFTTFRLLFLFWCCGHLFK